MSGLTAQVRGIHSCLDEHASAGRRECGVQRGWLAVLQADSKACSGALDELMMMKTLAALIFDSSLDPRAESTAAHDPRAESTAAQCGRSAVVIDAKALHDALKKDGIGTGADKRASSVPSAYWRTD